jgi:AraC-like DNA-binding protein
LARNAASYKPAPEVGYEIGYKDVPFFRSVFKRYTGMSPEEHRQRFGNSLTKFNWFAHQTRWPGARIDPLLFF